MHIDTLQSVRIITYPKLIEVGQDAIVDTTAAAGASLYGKVRIFSAYLLTYFLKATVEFNIHVALIVFRQIIGTMI